MIKFLTCDLPVFLNLDVELIHSLLCLSLLLVVLEVVAFNQWNSQVFETRQLAKFLRYFDSVPHIPTRVRTASFALGP